MKRLLLLFFSLAVIHLQAQEWQQIGASINGESLDFLGASLSLSKDAQTLAIGGPMHTVINGGSFEYEKGKVEIYRWSSSNNNWLPKGNAIVGDNDYDYLGHAISLSSDGSVLAVGIPGSDAAGSDAGKVQVYLWNGNAWMPKGQPINGNTAGEEFGTTVQLNANGDILAVGAPRNNNNGEDTGQVSLFDWDGSAWVQKGPHLVGGNPGDSFGTAIAMSDNGAVIAIGAPFNVANSSSTEPGYVKVFTWESSNWVQRGAALIGEDEGDFFGQSVSLSGNGQILAIGAPWNSGQTGWKSGHVRVFEWNNNSWLQLGTDIDGADFDNLSGQAVALSADGETVAIGAPWNGLGGHGRVFTWANNAWQQRGEAINGENFSDDFGRALSLSGDGSFLAIAAPEHTVNGTGSGQVRVYDGSNVMVGINQPKAIIAKAYPNPILQDELHIELDKMYNQINVVVYNALGQLVHTQAYYFATIIDLDLKSLGVGIYLVNVKTAEGAETILKVFKH